MQLRTQFRTIVLSDIHLGTTGSKAKEATEFLRNYSCQKLILNGDIVDGWQLKQYGTWKKKHTAFFKTVLKQIVHYNTKVIYLRGNHDDFLDQIMPLKVGRNFSIRKDYTLTSDTRKFYVTHGDVFDSITSQMKWLAYLGDLGYTFLLWINKFYNNYRTWRGLPYYSLSQRIKSRIKHAVNYISDYEQKLTELARARGCDGVICGHIHQPAITEFEGIIYMNSGDWVESLSALVEDHDGNWSLLYYTSDLSEDDTEPELKESRLRLGTINGVSVPTN
ncbi:UDP-2,3-diacylglucosamine diphosphatase [Spirosoma sp.]|uniref:UDP-2,3-diacylglucosamine diphosphatase n=1 Tax=Spirosoma sp. TaxID=1899569 RepID=UPI003B3AF978